jgi:CRP/FNR family transcriptional regulator, cyclic AMP receptor protein
MHVSLETRYCYLRDHLLFKHLATCELQEVCLISNFKTFKKGEKIYFAHDEYNRFFLLKKGLIKIVQMGTDGHETVKEILQKGDLFGQITLEETHLNEYAVVLSEQVTCCSFRIDDFEKIIRKNPSLAIHFMKLVGRRFRRLEIRYTDLMHKDVRTRLLLFLKDWAEREGTPENIGISLKNYFTHQDIASLICTTRQTVSQLMNELKDNGLIAYSRSTLTIPNLMMLRKIAA